MSIQRHNTSGKAIPRTLVELALKNAETVPDEIAFKFLIDGDTDSNSLTYAELDRQARKIAAWLQSKRGFGERAVLLYPPGLDYISAYFGCLYAGVIAVPAYPPRLNRPVPRIQGIVSDSQAAFALTTTEIYENLEKRFEQAPELKGLGWLDTQQLPTELEGLWREPDISPDALAFLQYTSGSTSQPKGVMVTHANLLYNLEQIRVGFRLDEFNDHDVVGISWLPSYHDMGLIGGILVPIYCQRTMILMSPLDFLQRPFRWLQAINNSCAAVSGGPNFAYEICLEKVRQDQIETIDLSCWKLAFCGAEPIRMETLDLFAKKFAPCGFRLDRLYPCYGLAEATLFVSGYDGPGVPRSINVRRAALEQGYAEPAQPGDQDQLALVDCGQAILEEKIIIADPENLTRCPDGMIGEIWISGENVTQGYWNRPEDTQRTFNAYLLESQEGPYLRTGDLGFLRDGSLFVTGRLKDMIIIRGTNHYPQDIELTVEKSHSACQVGGGAAFAISVNGEEHLVVVQEVTRQARKDDMGEVFQAIRSTISENHDLQVYAIVLIRPLSIPKTSSGKIQRHAAHNAFLHNELEVIAEWRVKFPEA